MLTVLSWIALCLMASIPFMFLGRDASVANALFEAVSGLTATGATVLTGLDHLPPGMLLWRSILQWIGGVGIVVMALVMLPFLRVGGMQLFRTESSDRSDKFMPRVGEVISLIAVTYLTLTFCLRLCLLLGRHDCIRCAQPCHDHGLHGRILHS